MSGNVTSDLSNFGSYELTAAINLLEAINDEGFPEGFYTSGVVINFNTVSGKVFLVNSDYQVAMINEDTGKLEQWYWCPYCGHEGFKQDIKHTPEDPECTRYLTEIGVIEEAETMPQS